MAYRIPRKDFNKLKSGPKEEDLSNPSIYLLFGEKEGEKTVYVGQASARKNGNAALQRIPEPHSTEDWDTAVILTTKKNDEFGRSELCYLENLFYNMAREAGSFTVVNNIEPPTDKSIKEKEKRRLGKYVDHVQLLIKLLGYNVFDKPHSAAKEKNTAAADTFVTFYCRTRGADAVGYRTEDGGFTVLKGSILSMLPPTGTCREAAVKSRKDNEDAIRNGRLLRDINFSSPSAASNFVTLSNTNGNKEWKKEDGVKPGGEKDEMKAVPEDSETDIEFHCTARGASAFGYPTSSGFVVRKGSILTSLAPTDSCPASAMKALKEAEGIIKDNRLTEDITFRSPSAASSFVIKASSNGRTAWHTEDGSRVLADYIK